MAVSVDDAFLSSLLDGLDPDTFAPPSSSPPRRLAPSKSKLVHKPKPSAANPTRAASHRSPTASSSNAGAGGGEKGPKGPTVRAPATVNHFWAQLDAGVIKNAQVAAPASSRVPSTNGSEPKTASGGMGRHQPDAARGKAQPSAVHLTPHRKPPKSVSIELEPHTNGVKPSFKGKERVSAKAEPVEVDFDALCDGMDWEADTSFSPLKTPTKEHKPRMARETSAGHIPHGKRFTRCTVLDIIDGYDSSTRRPQKTLHVRVQGSDATHQVVLTDDWLQTTVALDDTVHFIGNFDRSSTPSLTVSRSEGLLILHPDLLVSSTKVADSSHCARKALLQEIIRSSENSTASLAYGNMLHELMQACLMEEEWSDGFVASKTREIVEREVPALWGIGLEVDQAMEEMRKRSEGFSSFADKFVGDVPRPDAFLSDLRATSDAARARLAVSRTLEVEEDIWSPAYGLKGKIDVSLSARIADGPIPRGEKTMPFEIKTGKSSGGMEHRAQTMLYTLLMSDRYDELVEEGLLYYSQTGEVIRVKPARNEIRGLIIARNEFATYLHRRANLSTHQFKPVEPEVKADESEDEYDMELPAMEDDEPPALLPAPIDDHRSCKWCYVSDACMIYRRAVEGELAIHDDAENPMQVLFEGKTGHLTDSQAEFFREWERLISLEEQEVVRFKKEIWTMTARERANVGRCLPELKIDQGFFPAPSGNAGAKIHRYTYRLHPAQFGSQPSGTQQQHTSLIGGSISANDPVVVSVEQPSMLAISRGFVLEITAESVVLGLDHSLTDSVRLASDADVDDLVFRVDKDELAAGLGRIRDNVLQLFVAKGGDYERRRLVVDLDPPAFEAECTDASRKRIAEADLNNDQRQALDLVLRAKDYALILGMPGTGKTTTIAELLKQLVAEGKSVLLTSYTHSAVDNILLKVQHAGLSILRLGNRDKIMPALHKFTLDPAKPASTLAQMDELLMTPKIVATTCLGINDPLFARRKFDVCIVDEASQVTLPTCLGPLRFADKFVLVGDHHQLPPLVRNQAAREGGLDVSLFKRLSDAHPKAMVYLTEQYRMNGDIMRLSNRLVYDGMLKVGNERVDTQRLVIPCPQTLASEDEWLRDVLDPERSVVFVDTDALPARERKSGPLIDNPVEAALVQSLTCALIRSGVKPSEMGIIAPYRHQIKLLCALHASEPAIEILTADKSQGRDKEVILMSLVRSNSDGQVGDLLRDWRRWNVCLTRAKAKLVVVGSRSTLQKLELMRRFFQVVDESRWMYVLPPGAVGPFEECKKRVKGEGKAEEGAKKVRRNAPAERVVEGALVKDVVNELL